MWFRSTRHTRRGFSPRCLQYRPRVDALEDRCLLSAGALDPTFGNGAGYVTTSLSNYDDCVNSVLIQPDGKILAAGSDYAGSKKVAPPEVFAVVRYNADGSLDASFGSGGQAVADFPGQLLNGWRYSRSFASALYPQAGTVNDGKIVLVGGHATNGNGALFALARFNTNGALDATFGPSSKSPGEVTTSFPVIVPVGSGAHGVVVQADGKIVAAGASTSGFVLARYTANGALDSSFGSGGEVVTSLGQTSDVAALLQQPDGKLIVVGDLATASGQHVLELARYDVGVPGQRDGSLDISFGNGGLVSASFGADDYAEAAALYPSGLANAGKIVLVGISSGPDGIVRFNSDGTLDSTFGTGGVVTTGGLGNVSSVAIAADGKLLVSYNNPGFALARYNTDGSLDSTFGNSGTVTTAIGSRSRSNAMALQANGDIVVAGQSSYGSKWNFAVARYLPSEPEIGSFTASAYTVSAGSSVTLTASNITDGNPNSTITQVAFYYYDSTGAKHVLGDGTQTSPGVWTLNYTVNLASGTYTLYAQAEDSYGVFGDPIGLALQVQ